MSESMAFAGFAGPRSPEGDNFSEERNLYGLQNATSMPQLLSLAALMRHTNTHSRNPQNYFSAYACDKAKDSPLGEGTRYRILRGGPLSLVFLADPPAQPTIPDLSNVPKFPVPPGEEMSLKRAGLSLNHMDLLSALIAQHQTSIQGASIQEPVEGRLGAENTNPAHSKSDSPASTTLYDSNSSTQPTPLQSSGPSLAEMDKRKRSLAASARFRVKKKMKEKVLKDQIAQLSEMVRTFEMKIDELELENRLLKNLIIEKGNKDSEKELKLMKECAKHADT